MITVAEKKEEKEEKKPEASKKEEAKKAETKGKPKKEVKEKAKEGKKVEVKEEKKEVRPKPRKRRVKPKVAQTKAKKKRAVAHAIVRKGKGRLTLNKLSIDLIRPYYVMDFIKEPLNFLEEADLQGLDITVKVKGGGFMGQAVSARAAIAKSLVNYTKDKKLKDAYMKYDRMLLVDDPRRVESKKPLGTKARKKRQSSKR